MSRRQDVISGCRSAMRFTIGIRASPEESAVAQPQTRSFLHNRPTVAACTGKIPSPFGQDADFAMCLTGKRAARREARMCARLPERDSNSLKEPVAQPVEHVTFNHGVLGSSPSGLTNKIKGLQE